MKNGKHDSADGQPLGDEGIVDRLEGMLQSVLGQSDDTPVVANGARDTFTTKVTMNYAKLAQHVHDQSKGAATYATVIALCTNSPRPVWYAERITVQSCAADPQLVGTVGYAIGDPRTDGSRAVIFSNGFSDWFWPCTDGISHPNTFTVTPPAQDLAVINLDGRILEIIIPEDVIIQPGQVVRLNDHLQFAGAAPIQELGGDVVIIEQVLSATRCLVTMNGTVKGVFVAPSVAKLEVGHRVQLDRNGSIAVKNLGMSDGNVRYYRKPRYSWADVGGLAEAKHLLQNAICRPYEYAELFEALHKEPAKGALLIGPPGCGKSMLVEAAFDEFIKRHGDDRFREGCFWLNGSDVLRSLVGEGEAIIRLIFRLLDEFEHRTGIRGMLFIDEIDAIGKKRGTGISSDATDSYINALLPLMSLTNAFILIATNRPDILDEALTRHQRISDTILIGRPDQRTCADIIEHSLHAVPLDGLDARMLGEQLAAEYFSKKYPLFQLTVVPTAEGEPTQREFHFHDLSSGALLYDLVEKAKNNALDRLIAAREKGESPKAAVTYADCLTALQTLYEQDQLKDHTDAVVASTQQRIINLQRKTQTRK